MSNHIQLILIMDHRELPQHLKQTFSLVENSHGWASTLVGIEVAVEGQDIDLKAAGYVLAFASNDYHRNSVMDIHQQIQNFRPDAMIMALPVEVEVKQQTYTHTFSPIDLSAWNPVPFPGKP